MMGNINLKERVSTANFLLGRIASVPSYFMEQLNLQETNSLHQKIYNLKQEIQHAMPEVNDILYKSVPQIKDNTLRRYILKLNRDIYNGRSLDLKMDYIYRLDQLLSANEKATLQNHLTQYNDFKHIMIEANSVYNLEIESISNNLLNLMNSEDVNDMMKGIVLASEDFAQAILKDKKDLYNYKSILSNTTFTYLQRSALKTSPFSALTQLKYIPIEEKSSSVCESSHKSSLKLNRSIISTIVESFALYYKNLFMFKFNPQVKVGDHTYFIKSSYKHSDGFPWKTKDVLKNSNIVKIYNGLVEHYERETYKISEIKERLGSKSTFIIRQLLSSKVLRPMIPWDIRDERIFHYMKDFLIENKVDHDELIQVFSIIDRLIEELKDYEIDVNQRLNNVIKLRKHVNNIFTILDIKKPYWINDTNMIYEDVRSSNTNVSLPEDIEEQLKKIHEKVSSDMQILPMYQEIVDYFLKEYGEDGTCNLLSFIFTIYASGHDNLNYFEMVQDSYQKVREGEAENKPERNSIAKPTSTIYFQIVPNNVSEKGYDIVVNKVSTGMGNIFSRFVPLLGEAYQKSLRDWIETTFYEGNVAEFTTGGDWSNLQENFNVLKDAVDSIAELSYHTGRKNIDITKLRISYNSYNHTLDILDDEGQIISPVYLGTIPQHLLNGPANILLTLVNPWTANTNIGINPRPWENKEKKVDQISFVPREQEGNIIYKRAQWEIPFSELPMKHHNESEVDYFIKVNDFRLKHGIPLETYMSTYYIGDSMIRKPMWMNFCNPYCLEVLKKKKNHDIEYVIFTEALPSSDEAFYTNTSGQPLNTELMSLNRTE
ncbi:hypothetical protein [Virgibacillus dokdonensis]|uniref:hypothetical protein n=1 Tax=Virgibacillus dokdonensis TaxID=302167 RepID=UPI00098A5BF5|nr:hypothetical protein [Virgibacillus dokdonensis]